MKKLLALLLAALMLLACASALAEVDPELLEAAQDEGELVVYGSCEEPYLIAACQKFEELYDIKVDYQRLSTGEVQTKITEEKGNPSADVWFGGTNDPYNEAAKEGLLMAYEPANAVHLLKPTYRDPDGYWFGIYQGILGFMVNQEELDRLGVEAPKTWDDLLKPEYQGLIWLSNPNTAGTAKLVINTMVQMKGHDEGIQYLVDLDKNIAQYTKSGSGPSKNVGTGECIIGIGFLHDGVYQILQGCEHPNAAKLWIEFALSPDCVELADDAGSYQFLVLDNAQQPEALQAFPELDPSKTIDYDFADAKENTSKYVADYFDALGAAADDRFKTE